MSERVRYIHTQAQAQAELERCRLLERERYRRKRLRHAAADKDATRYRKQNHIQDNLFHIDTKADADRMATMREAQKETNLQLAAEERADVLNKIQQR